MAVASIAFHLTDRCQLDCRHCLRDPGKEPRDLPLAIIEKVLAEASQTYRTTHVALTGGEPTLHPRFPEVIDAIVGRGLTWHLVTNGKRIRQLLAVVDEVPLRREKLTAIDLSLDGASEQTHDAIRGRGSYREVMAAAALCAARQLPFVLLTTVNARNCGELEEIGLLASHLGAARVAFSMIQATGADSAEALRLTPAAARLAQERIARLQAALTLPVGMPEGFPREQPFHVCDALRSEQLHVDVLGRLSLCCQLSGVPGDGTTEEIAADLADTSLVDAHRRLLEIIHRFQADRLDALARQPPSSEAFFPCNWCAQRFGKPYWTERGSCGPEARRARREPRARARVTR